MKSENQIDRLPAGYGRPLIIWLIAACLFVLLAGVVGYFSLVAQLKKQVWEEQARGIAQAVDAIVKARSASVATAARVLDLDNLVSENGGSQLPGVLKDQFPDFLSLEVMDQGNQILAMFGDLSLSDAGRKTRVEDTASPVSGQDSFKEVFQDHPQGDCFFVTTRQTAADGTTWFTRTRFARKPIETALASVNANRIAELQSVANCAPAAKGFTGWWASEAKAEVQLVSPGWMIVLKAKPAGSPLSRHLAAVLGAILFALGLGYLIHRRASILGKASSHCGATEAAGRTPLTSNQLPANSPQEAVAGNSPDPSIRETPIVEESATETGSPEQMNLLPDDLCLDEAETQPMLQRCQKTEGPACDTITRCPAPDPPSGASVSGMDNASERPDVVTPEALEPRQASDSLSDIDTLEMELSGPDAALNAIPEILEITWVEPHIEEDPPKKRERQRDFPSAFASL
ncbi:MAG: hypothetical protein HY913_11290 [Desulfomonile tiedjei]|nr:hypothetical protein [Desulfomonile tiedjei]